MRILLVDDDEDLRNLLSRYIRSQWPDAEIEAYDPLERDLPEATFPLGTYDVVVLDYMLGRGDGLEWLKVLKQRTDCPKILFLTGAGNEIIAVRAMKAGADDYQRKQELTREKLLASLHELTAGIKELRLIGEGGMARVYLASREGDDDPLVVKILRREILANKIALARFMEEYEMVERIQSRHVARVYGHGNSEDHA